MNKKVFPLCMFCAAFFLPLLMISCRSLPAAPQQEAPAAYTVKTMAEKLSYVESDLSYPEFESVRVLNDAVQDTVLKRYNNFKGLARRNWAELDAYRREVLGEAERTPPFTYKVQHQVVRSERYICVLLTYYEDDGGAHGNTTLKSFVYDRVADKLVSASDVSGQSYARLSAQCRQKLTAALVDGDKSLTVEQRRSLVSMINAGTAADAEHLSCFTTDGKTLTMYFEPYAVAPYAYGIQTVQLPLS